MRVNTYFSSAVGWLAHSMPKSHSKVQASVCLIRKPASQRASEFARARPNVSLFTKLFFFSLLLWFLSFIQSICAIFQMNGRQRRSKGDGPMGKGKIHDIQKAKMMFKDFVYAIARTHRWWSHGKNFNLMCTYLKATRFVAFECSLTLFFVFRRSAHSVYETYSCLLLLRRRTSQSQVGNDFQSTSKTTRCAYVCELLRDRRISLCFASSFYSSSSRGGERRKKNYPSFVYAQSIRTWRTTNAMLSLRHWWAMLKTSRSAKMTY